MAEAHTSEYWKSEIERTELALAEAINETTTVKKTTTGDGDSIEFQDLEKLIKYYRGYINFCNTKYNEALVKEESELAKPSILYINREFGY